MNPIGLKVPLLAVIVAALVATGVEFGGGSERQGAGFRQ